MKKGYIIALLASSFLLLAGCGNGEKTASSTETTAEDTQVKTIKEIPIGDPIEKEFLEIAAVYFEASELYPENKAGLHAHEADIHLEADIKALKGNITGFGVGEWVPYLTVNYNVKNLDSGEEFSGTFMPMNAADGPHYGANVKMLGAGEYKLSLTIESPEKQNYLLHVDQASGVEGKFWTSPIEVEWEFPYMPKN